MNNLEKKVVIVRMPTSLDEIYGAYLNFYNIPGTRVRDNPNQHKN
jgi:hypothetical protein